MRQPEQAIIEEQKEEESPEESFDEPEDNDPYFDDREVPDEDTITENELKRITREFDFKDKHAVNFGKVRKP